MSAASALFVAATLAGAAHQMHKGNEKPAAILLTLALMAAATSYLILSPGGIAFLALVPVIIVAVVLPFVRRTTLVVIFIGSWIAGGLLYLVTLLWIPPVRAPEWLDLTFRGTGYVALLALTLSLLYSHHQRLSESLKRTRTESLALRKAHDELRESEQAKTRFLNAAAHELRTPLTPLLLQVELLRRNPCAQDDPKFKVTLELVERNLDRLKVRVDDLLDIVRSRDQKAHNIRRTPLTPTLKEAEETIKQIAEAKGVQLEVQAQTAILVWADPDRILQVLLNLLSNALEATDEGDSIHITSFQDDTEAHVQVHDTGIGIDPAQQVRLFEPFDQLTGPGEPAKGSGMGLYICRSIVQAHGGRIFCTSRGRGHGATFEFTLPVADLPARQDLPEDPPPPTGPSSGADPRSSPRSQTP